MKVLTYLVVGRHKSNGRIGVRKATTRYPALEASEAVIKLELTLPDDIFEAPLFTVEVQHHEVEVAVEPQEVER